MGRFSKKENKPAEPKNNLPSIDKEEIQKLKDELNLVKNKLNQSNSSQKSQLESKLSNVEEKIKILTSQDKSVIQKLVKEIKEIKEKIKNDKPDDNPPPYTPPSDKNKLQFMVYYFVELGKNHMWIANDSDKMILIDKENPIFPNNELTKKGKNYTITFLPQDAEKFHNQDHVYYFSKNNNKFTLEPKKPDRPEPVPSDKKEGKFFFAGDSSKKSGYCKFGGERDNDAIFFYISKNYPRIKELSSQGKLQLAKQFTIRYGKADEGEKDFFFTFNENNQELEIIEEN